MKRVLQIIFVLAICVGIGGALWYYRPWSKYSPYKIAEMQKPENLVTTFRTMSEIFPFRVVGKGDNVSPFQEDVKPLSVSYEWEGKTKTLEQYHKEGVTTGFMVLKDGVIRHENYLLNANRETRFTSWSMAKSFVATVIFMALKEGKLESLDDKAQKYAPQFKGSGFGDSRIRDLLIMSTGVKFNERYSDPDSDIRPYFFDTFILGINADKLLLPFQRNRPANSDFHYISPNTHVLSAVLRGVYKKPLAEIISEKIWKPLGMESDGYWNQNIEGNGGLALGYCCLNARLRDYARFGQFYLDSHSGTGKGPEVLPEGWPEILRKPATEKHAPNGDHYNGRGYSYHFWIPVDPDGEYFASGVYGQYTWIDPKRGIVIVRTAADVDWKARARESMAVMKAVAKVYAE